MFKDFFYLQRNDRQAIFVLLGCLIVCTALIIVIGKLSPNKEDSSIQTAERNIPDSTQVNENKPKYYKVDGVAHELFPFDPNTADSTQLLKLGLQAWQVRSIYKYRAKGGIFREPSDFARLYGLTKRQYEVLAPYIIIGEDFRPATDYYGQNYNHGKYANSNRPSYVDTHSSSTNSGNVNNSQEGKLFNYPHKLKPGEHISVNTSDTTELMKIPGIGSYYAKTIIRYREQLGGFYSIDQLREINDFPESALPFIKVNPGEIKKININQLSLNQLRRHPYINFYQAKAICDYRRLKGPLKSLEDLKLSKDFPPDEIKRLQPYICF